MKADGQPYETARFTLDVENARKMLELISDALAAGATEIGLLTQDGRVKVIADV